MANHKSHFWILEHNPDPDPDPDPQITPKQDKSWHFTANLATYWSHIHHTYTQIARPHNTNSACQYQNPDPDPQMTPKQDKLWHFTANQATYNGTLQ